MGCSGRNSALSAKSDLALQYSMNIFIYTSGSRTCTALNYDALVKIVRIVEKYSLGSGR